MSIQTNSPIRRSWGNRTLVGVGAVLLAMLFISQAPVEVEPAPAREPIGTLTMGVVLGDLPYQDMTADGGAVGSEVELFSAAARAMAIPVEFVGGAKDTLLARLQAGEIDGIVGVPYRAKRNAAFYFYLRPYGSPQIAAIVPQESEVETIWDLRGRDVLVQGGSEAESYVLAHGLSKNLRRELDLDACFEELSQGVSYSAVFCDAARAQSFLADMEAGAWKVVPGGLGAPRCALLAAGFNAFAGDLEKGFRLTSEAAEPDLAATTVTARELTGNHPVFQPARSLGWLPYAIVVMFGMGFVMVLMTNRRISRRARFLISELEERIRAEEWAKQKALLEKGNVGRRNRRSVIR